MDEEKANINKEKRDVVGAVLLIFLGVVMLMVVLGLLPWSVWPGLSKLWPVLIIMAGFKLMVGDSRLGEMMLNYMVMIFFGGVLIALMSTYGIKWSELFEAISQRFK